MDLNFSRRDFLKASGAGLLGLFLADLRLERVLAAETPKQGRSTVSGVNVFSEPFFNANTISLLRQDEVVEIIAEIQGDKGYGNPFNSTWYQINGEGYVYSGTIQPVDTLHQKPVFDISEISVLGEITVPFSDTRRASSVFADRGYRVYYSTTHWITDTIVNRDEKSIWYKIFDRLTQESYFVPSHEMRVISPNEFSSLSSEVPEEKKRIYVDLATQTVTAFESENPVLVTRCASGAKGTETLLGEFRTYHKGPSVHMTNQGDGTENTYHLPGVPWVSFFTGSGVAFHGTYWHNDYGRPSSRGCVNLTPNDAKFIYRWTRPEVPIGTPYLNQPGEGTLVQIVLSNP
ncbi:MAG TPA: L,D-transpeptidase family protein [Pyrinomonadaceae bacterium]|nr:L,D-transpeptidase family protein [Pyrinomonadaceae bacterium]